MTPQAGLKAFAWAEADERDPGVYCASGGLRLDVDLEELKLHDTRLLFLAPADFRREPIIDELRSIRPDATWEPLDLPAREASFASIPDRLHPACTPR